MASLAERDTIMISGFILISISLSDEPESFISALQDILGKLRSTIKKPIVKTRTVKSVILVCRHFESTKRVEWSSNET